MTSTDSPKKPHHFFRNDNKHKNEEGQVNNSFVPTIEKWAGITTIPVADDLADNVVQMLPKFPDHKAYLDTNEEAYTATDDRQGCFFKDGVRRIDFVLVYPEHKAEHSSLRMPTMHNLFHHQEEGKEESRRNFFLENLKQHGLELEIEKIEKEDETMVFVKVHATFNELCQEADRLNIEMPLKLHDEPVKETQIQIAEFMSKAFSCFYCSKTAQEQPRLDSTLIYYPFDDKDIELYDIRDPNRFFSDNKRTEMTWEILQAARNDPEDVKNRGIEGLIEAEIFECAYPVHEAFMKEAPETATAAPGQLRQNLKNTWASWRNLFFLQPIHKIRNYFGEKIGFYFAFMDFYLKQLIFPTIAGWIVFIYGVASSWNDDEVESICNEHEPPGSNWMCPICTPPGCEPWKMGGEEGCMKYKWGFALDNEATVAMSCFLMVWAIFFLKFWKRHESIIASDWKTSNVRFHDSAIRPEYEEMAHHKTRQNPVTLKVEPYVPLKKRALNTFISLTVTICILCISGAALAALVVSRIAMYGALRKAGGFLAKYNIDLSRWFIHFLIFVLVIVTEKIYSNIGVKLTTFECPRSHHDFMHKLLWKLFIFELINECYPVIYAAFLRGKTVSTPLQLSIITELCDAGCMGEVVELVFVLLTLRLVVGNIMELGVPFLRNIIKRKQAHVENHEGKPQWLQDFYLNEVELDGVYEDYMEMMIQFAFVVLFISAFPLAPFLCLINNIIEIRLDAIKMLMANRRPLPMRVPGIQIWNTFLDIIVKLGIIVNAAMIGFVSDVIPRFYYENYYDGYEGYQGSKHYGYSTFALSYINVSDWDHDHVDHHNSGHDHERHEREAHDMLEEFHELNITQCYYQGFYEKVDGSFHHKRAYWVITTIRLAAFAIFSLTFYIIMWLVNVLIPDVPGRVKTKVARQAYSAKKHLNEQRRKNKAKRNESRKSR